MIPHKTKVRTTKNNEKSDWIHNRECVWGVEGIIIGESTAHGLCYLVSYKDGSGGKGWYEEDELEIVFSEGERIVNKGW